MKTLYSRKAIALYETRISAGYIVMTVIMYIIAALLWYVLEAILPYTENVVVDDDMLPKISREALTATPTEKAIDEREKERAFLMPSGESSFCRRLRLIEDARSSIDFMTHKSYKHDFTLIFYAALLRAADRGVRVRIIVDGKVGRLNGCLSEMGRLLQNHNNIEFYYYNETDLLDPAGLLVLMHDKVMLADEKIAIVGGINMGRGTYTENYDMEVMITNSGENGCAGAIKRYYDRTVTSTVARRIVSQSANLAAKTQYIDNYLQYFTNCEFVNSKIDYDGLGIPVNKITYLTNGSEGKNKQPTIYKAICNLGISAEETVMVTPYMLLEGDKKRDMIDMAEHNKSFTVITNSLYNTRNVAYADYYYTRKAYVNDNITLLEYQADDQIHAKIYTFDGKYSVIGSFNLDERSSHIDTESVVIIDSEEFTALLNDYINEKFAKNSLRVGADNKYIPSETVKERKPSPSKRILYGLYRVLGVVRCII